MPQVAEKERKTCHSIPPDIIINSVEIDLPEKEGSLENGCFG